MQYLQKILQQNHLQTFTSKYQLFSITAVEQRLEIDGSGMLAVMMEVEIDSLGTLS